jgi:hypothetical protein
MKPNAGERSADWSETATLQAEQLLALYKESLSIQAAAELLDDLPQIVRVLFDDPQNLL